MGLFSIVRFAAALLSLLILGAAVYWLWSWYEGVLVYDAAGRASLIRETWRLWAGVAAGAWSLLGKLVVVPLLASRDTRPTGHQRGEGQLIQSPTGAALYIETHGRPEGPLLVFTHGWGMDSTFWRYAREDLADRFQLVLWDLPGLGRSKLPRDGRVVLSRFAEDLASLAERSAGRPVVLIGHSIGGITIQTLLRDRPEMARRLAGVVLLNTTYTNPLKTMVLSGLATALRPMLEIGMRLMIWLQPLVWLGKWQSYLSGSSHMAHRLGFGRFVTRSQLEHVTLLSTRNPPAVLAKGDLAMFRWDATDALAGLRLPVLVIGGDKDIVTKLEANRTIAQETPSARLEVVEGVNHMGPMERADLYNRMIADFVLSLQPGHGDERLVDGASPSLAEPAPRPSRSDGVDRSPPPFA